jgi:hypothetical protein
MSDAHPKDFPRVLRIRNLLADDQSKPLHEITRFNWHVFCGVLHPEGSFFVADGLHRGPDGDAQEIIAFDVTTGNQLWRHQRSQDHRSPFLAIDPLGTTVAYTADGGGRSELVELPSGQSSGRVPEIAFALASDGRFVMSSGEKRFDGEEIGVALRSPRKDGILLLLGIDYQPQAISPQFSRDDRFVALGTKEGIVFVCDLDEIDRRLVELGFPSLKVISQQRGR